MKTPLERIIKPAAVGAIGGGSFGLVAGIVSLFTHHFKTPSQALLAILLGIAATALSGTWVTLSAANRKKPLDLLLGGLSGLVIGILFLWEVLWAIKKLPIVVHLEWDLISRVPDGWLAHNLLLFPALVWVFETQATFIFAGMIALLVVGTVLVISLAQANPNFSEEDFWAGKITALGNLGRRIYPQFSDGEILFIIGLVGSVAGAVILVWGYIFWLDLGRLAVPFGFFD